jgi:hypothetical protein
LKLACGHQSRPESGTTPTRAQRAEATHLRATWSTAGPAFCGAACGASGTARRGRACKRAWRGSSGRHEAGPDPRHEREAVPAHSCELRRPRAQAWARGRRPLSARCRRSAIDAVSRRGFWRCRRVASPFVRGPARSAAAPLKRKWCEPRYAVSANVTRSDVFLHARCLVGAPRGWADGRRGATRHREFTHAHAL